MIQVEGDGLRTCVDFTRVTNMEKYFRLWKIYGCRRGVDTCVCRMDERRARADWRRQLRTRHETAIIHVKLRSGRRARV